MERHLVIQLARFGDLVQTKRFLASLAGGPSESEGPEIHLCLDRSLAPLAGLLYPSVTLHPITAHKTSQSGTDDRAEMLAANREVFGRLKSIGFDRVWNLNFSGLNFSLASLFDPTTVRGYRTVAGQSHMDTWPSLAMRWTRRRRTSGLNLVDLWGAYAENMIPPGQVNPAAEPKGGGLGVVLAGRHSRRSLPPEVLAPLVAVAARGGRITLLGSELERPFARALLRELRGLKSSVMDQVDDLSGRTGWRELIDVVSSLDSVLTPDTGTMHLAAHLGVPVQALFLSSAWCFETGPYGLGHTVWQAIQPCSPCLESRPCDHDMACLNPFATPDFLRTFGQRVQGGGLGSGVACPGVVGYASCLDAVGATYEPFSGEDPDRSERAAFRAFIGLYLGLGEEPASATTPKPSSGMDSASSTIGTTLAARYLQERDWMLGRTEEPSIDGPMRAVHSPGSPDSSDPQDL